MSAVVVPPRGSGPPTVPLPSTRVLLSESEDDIVGWALDWAWKRRWWEWHCYDSRRSRKGFPDYVFIRERVIYVEFKREKGRVTPAQVDVGRRLVAAGAEYHLWRPSDRNEILRVLW